MEAKGVVATGLRWWHVGQNVEVRQMGKWRAVVADDSAVMRQLIETALTTAEDFEVVGLAKDGVEANQLAKRVAFDVMLLDVNMPRLDGLTLLEGLHRMRRTVPVVICSSTAQEGSPQTLRARELGVTHFVEKPGGSSGRNTEEFLSDLLAAARAVAKSAMPG